MKIFESDNFKAVLVWILMCCGLSLMVGIVVKLFTPKPQPPVTTINQYFVNNKEVTQYGIPKQLNGY
jgi:predicted phage tail protein